MLTLVLLCWSAYAANIPMSPCIYGRAVGGYDVSKAAAGSGVPTTNWDGTCHMGNAQADLPAWFANGFLATPDDETYNGFPFVSGPLAIEAGLGLACGECFELTGDKGSIVVMSTDICDKKCGGCDNCQGSLGGPQGGPDVPNFDVNGPVWSMLTAANNGGTPLAYRKVSCDMSTITPSPTSGMGVMFHMLQEGNVQEGYFRIRVFGHAIGVASMEVKGDPLQATKGNWTKLDRFWEGGWNWTSRGNIGCPFQVRITSILNETVTLPVSITTADLVCNKKFYFNKQFNLPTLGYGGGNAAPCVWPGPDPVLYSDGFGGDVRNKWVNWGGSTVTQVNFADTVGCLGGTGKCISWNSDSANGQIQIGFGSGVGAPTSYYKTCSIWMKAAMPGAKIFISWGSTSGQSPNRVTVDNVSTTWTNMVFNMSQFWGSTAGFLQVLHIQTPVGISTTRFLQFDEIMLGNITIQRVQPIADPRLAGPPPIGFPGYTGPDPLNGSPIAPTPDPTQAPGQNGAAAVLQLGVGWLVGLVALM